MALFSRFTQSLSEHIGEWETLEEMMQARADIAIRRALDGFGITFDEAIDLIRNAKDLDDEQLVKRNILIAAIDNLVDFSVVAEYQMADEIAELEQTLYDEEEEDDDDEEDEDEDDEDEELISIYKPLFSKYNDRHMRTENLDVEYAMAVAAYLSSLKSDTILMYMTMGDERVRPWHLQYEGFTAPKSSFPAWLIPPIEHQCRCYLIEDTSSTVASVRASATPEMPEWFNKTFKESVALGGRIFSDEHPYFQVDERHIGRLNTIAKRIKSIYFENGAT